MNINTGELRNVASFLSEEEAAALGFAPVPDEHEAEARKIIADAEREKARAAYADMSLDTPLVNWAKSQQKPKNKNKAKMTKASRRRNRK
jgi:hypothetical protein